MRGVLGRKWRWHVRYVPTALQRLYVSDGQAAGWLNDEEKEELYRHEPGMWGRFVHGAPAVINHNVGTDRGLVNGAAH